MNCAVCGAAIDGALLWKHTNNDMRCCARCMDAFVQSGDAAYAMKNRINYAVLQSGDAALVGTWKRVKGKNQREQISEVMIDDSVINAEFRVLADVLVRGGEVGIWVR